MAFAIARPALEINDKIGARMAFKAAYDRLVAQNREMRLPAQWSASLGWDVERRRYALENAVQAGRLLPSQAQGLLPPPPADPNAVQKILQLACVNGETVNAGIQEKEIGRRELANIKELLKMESAK